MTPRNGPGSDGRDGEPRPTSPGGREERAIDLVSEHQNDLAALAATDLPIAPYAESLLKLLDERAELEGPEVDRQ